ncbi:MAG: hypothetical protein N2117_13730 [Anaerolineales bacterium]|nr:hypothetical protein [Anaerolineales bacterium]
MLFSLLLLALIVYLSWRAAPRERQEDAHVHGAGQVGLLAAIALFGVDYFTSYYYATGEMLHVLHPHGLDHLAYYAIFIIAIANITFGFLYMYFLGVFKEGGGSFAAAIRYLGPAVGLVVAVVLLQDYVFTIVVSTLSGADQLLSLGQWGNSPWYVNFLIGAAMVGTTWYITIRGRGESAQVVFTGLGIFVLLTLTMAVGLFIAKASGVPPLPRETEHIVAEPSIWRALFYLIAAAMKGLVALTGLEAMADGIQFVIEDDPGFVKWGKKHLPRLNWLWNYYSGKTGIGRTVQTAFLFYGALTTLFLTYFGIHFQAYDGVQGRTLVGNLAYIGFTTLSEQGGVILFWAYQILAVGLLTAASMTAFQDLQAITWRNVAIGEIPEVVVYRNAKGTFTRPVTAAAIAAILIQFLVRGNTSTAIPFYGVGVFLPITIMGLAMRRHVQLNLTGRARTFGLFGTTFSIFLSSFILVGQIVTKWNEGGWVVLLTMAFLILISYIILISPAGYRDPQDIHRIIREKSRVEGPMGNVVEWQSLKMQEYRYKLLTSVADFMAIFGVMKPLSAEIPAPLPAGDYEDALKPKGRKTFLEQYLASQPKTAPRLGGVPKETVSPPEEQE